MPIHDRDREHRVDAFRIAVTQIAQRLGHTPTQNEYKSHCVSERGIPTVNQVRYIFGTWTSAVESAGLTPAPRDPPRFEYSETQLIDEFIRIANVLGRMPPLEVFRQQSQYSNRPYQTRWGKWSDVIRHFSAEHFDRFTFEVTVAQVAHGDGRQRRPLGLGLPLTHEPTNEFETVALFALLAESLGFKIVSIGSAFPDGLLQRNGEQVVVKFEYLSSNYLRHCHPTSDEFTCICWRADCDISPVKLICLEDEVVRRRKANQKLHLTAAKLATSKLQR